jgi:hypothetical protein
MGQSARGTDAVALDGVFRFENLKIAMAPKSTNTFLLKFNRLYGYDNPISFIDEPISIKVTAYLCEYGERFSAVMVCAVCEPGSYLFERFPEPHDCNIC